MKTVKKVFLKGTLVGGRYRMLGRLGEGGMGIVYKATDITLNTDVVLKVPLLNLTKEANFAQRFKQELQSMIALSHPSIVRLLDLGEEEGVPYAVMPYLPGGDLNSTRPRDDSGSYLPVSLTSLEEWLVPVAKALDFVHRKGIIHRDIKPANILFDGEGNPFVTDFGIAKLVAEISDEAGTRMKTQTGIVLGTPDYTAPELIMGQAPEPRSDIFSLAMTVYELVTGKVPYSDLTPAAVLVKQATESVPSPSVFNPRLGDAFAKALLQGLEREPDRRPKTCLNFANAVCEAASLGETALAGKPEPKRTLRLAPVRVSSTAEPTIEVDASKLRLSGGTRIAMEAVRRRKRKSLLIGILSWSVALLLLCTIAYLAFFKLHLFGVRGPKETKTGEGFEEKLAAPLTPSSLTGTLELTPEKVNPVLPTEESLPARNLAEPALVGEQPRSAANSPAPQLPSASPDPLAQVVSERPASASSVGEESPIKTKPSENEVAEAAANTEPVGGFSTNPNLIDDATELAKAGKIEDYKEELTRLAKNPLYQARANFILAMGYALTRQSNSIGDDDEKAADRFRGCVESLSEQGAAGDSIAVNNVVACYNNLAIVDARRGRLESSLRNFMKALSLRSHHSGKVIANLVHLRFFIFAAESTKGGLFFKNPSSTAIRLLENLLQENGVNPAGDIPHSQVGWHFLPFNLSPGKFDNVFAEVGLKLVDDACINCRGQGNLDCPKCSGGKVTTTVYDRQTLDTPGGRIVKDIPSTVFVPCPACEGKGGVDCAGCDNGREKLPR